MSNFEILLEKPESYAAGIEVSVVFFHHRGKYLFLKRSEQESRPNTWCVPGGSFEPGETAEQAAVREVYEETSYAIEQKEVEFVQTFYIRTDLRKKTGFFLHMFYIDLNETFIPKLNQEHTAFQWLSWEEGEKLPLISGKGPAMDYYRRALETKKRLSSSY